MRMRRLAAAGATACLLLAMSLAVSRAAGVAAAPALTCGAAITHSTRLTADLGPCPGNGLVVTADGVTLDLAGHRIFGPTGQSSHNLSGILLSGVTNVTVRGPGSVSYFSGGVSIEGGQHNTVTGIDAHDNNSTQWSNDNPGLADYGDGIAIKSSSYNVIADNTVHDNGPFDGIGIFTDQLAPGVPGPVQQYNVIRDNHVYNNDVPDVCLSNGTFFGGPCNLGDAVFNEDIGIRIEGSRASFNTVIGNTVTGSGRDGISVLDIGGPAANRNQDNRIIDNTSDANGAAVAITDAKFGQLGGDGFFDRCYPGGGSILTSCPTGTVIIGNTFDGNPGHGLDIDAAQYATSIGNEAHGNGFGTQTIYGQTPPFTDVMDLNDPPCQNNTYLGNSYGTANEPCIAHHLAGGGAAAGAAAQAAGPASVTGSTVRMPARPGGRATI